MSDAQIAVAEIDSGGRNARLSGNWTLAALARAPGTLRNALADLAGKGDTSWDCTAIESLDSAGAMTLWRTWSREMPELLVARPEHVRIFERIARAEKEPAAVRPPVSPFEGVISVGSVAIALGRHLADFLALIGAVFLGIAHLVRVRADFPKREMTANLYKAGVMAMPVSALVGFLIGVVLSYLSSLQLKQFGADVFIVNILGMGIIRELGPVLVAVLVAGRSGSAMTAQLGVMRVTEEIDALSTMGISQTLRLVFPKVAGLSIAMPLLVLWTTVIALAGGMVAAQIQLDIGYGFFVQSLPKAVPAANLVIGLAKGVAFGIIIALVACHFGLRVRPNTESLSANTTASVVTAITMVILVDAVFAIATRHIGLPI
ncbi:MAG TPA: ABC transporter permease [Rhodocyclaceae bacterium]|nr:ABC transporter permease [Rhodocyclaceae bacterium]